MRKKQKILIVVGPTASGKSTLAVELARRLNGEVISADSRQVYRGLDIGTGKITKREMKGVPHHLLDIVSLRRTFTAHDFALHAGKAIADIAARGKLPIVCGGTGFYIDALLGRIALPNVPPNRKLRAQLAKKSTASLFVMLKKRDPRRAQTIEPQNKRRLIRALEIVNALGKNPPPRSNLAKPYDALWLGLAPSDKKLRRNIAARLLARIRQGMIAEAKRLHANGLSYKQMEELGLEYRSLARFLQEKITHTQMNNELRRDIRRYAKKQMAYWRRNGEIEWFKPSQKRMATKVIQHWLKK